MRDVVKRVLQQRREGEGEEHIPFIDNLLQSGCQKVKCFTMS